MKQMVAKGLSNIFVQKENKRKLNCVQYLQSALSLPPAVYRKYRQTFEYIGDVCVGMYAMALIIATDIGWRVWKTLQKQ